MQNRLCSRRHWMHSSAFGLAGVAGALLLQEDGWIYADDKSKGPSKPDLEPRTFDLLPKQPHHEPKAKAMISMFMIGGPSQIDMFDPKPELTKLDGKDFPGQVKYDNLAQASRQVMGPQWRFAPRGQCGMEMSDLIPNMCEIADEMTLIRSMQTNVNNHLPSMYALNSGVGVGGSPSLGSWLTYGLGSVSQELPAFVALTHPSGLPLIGGENWTNGGLPSIYQGTVVRPKEPRILNLDPPEHLKGRAQAEQLAFLQQFNASHLAKHPNENDLAARMSSYELAAKMQLAAKDAFDISKETEDTHKMYGIDREVTRDYGTRCLIARRLVERGVRFVQIFNNGQSWDHHDSIVTNLPKRCDEIDRPAAALVKDLKQRGLLDTTIVHWGGEMGRLPTIQVPPSGSTREKVGRDHNTYGFSMWVAGGGFKSGYVHGKTDDFSHYAIEGIVQHHDWLATVLHLFGLDHAQLRYKTGVGDLRLVQSAAARIAKELLA
ncbi:MAG: DUF1501 domain-containing protein [Planctomycetota bacterium]|nr:DUF1501 domain-containing protein [Planctomycetota bacterium]